MRTRLTFAIIGAFLGVITFFVAFRGVRSGVSIVLPELVYGVTTGGFLGYVIGVIVELASSKYKLRGPDEK